MHKKSTYLPFTFHSFPFFNLFCMPHNCRSIHMHFWDPAKFWGGRRKKRLIYFCVVLICGVELQNKVVACFGTSEEHVAVSHPFKRACIFITSSKHHDSINFCQGMICDLLFHTACSVCHYNWINLLLMRDTMLLVLDYEICYKHSI